jgi:hypothetical protein
MPGYAPHVLIRKAVDKLKGHHIYVVPFYREDGMEASVQIQDKVNGVLQDPFVLNLEVHDDKLLIRNSKLKWKDQKRLLPGVHAYKKAMKKAAANAVDIESKFTLLQNPVDPTEGNHFQHQETGAYPLNRVWTVVEGDNGKDWYALTGYHVVNKLFYLVSEQEWTDADTAIDYKY